MMDYVETDLCVQSPCGLFDGAAPSGVIFPGFQSGQEAVISPCRPAMVEKKTHRRRQVPGDYGSLDGRLVISVCQNPEIMRLGQSPDGGPAEMRFGSACRIAGHCADENFHGRFTGRKPGRSPCNRSPGRHSVLSQWPQCFGLPWLSRLAKVCQPDRNIKRLSTSPHTLLNLGETGGTCFNPKQGKELTQSR